MQYLYISTAVTEVHRHVAAWQTGVRCAAPPEAATKATSAARPPCQVLFQSDTTWTVQIPEVHKQETTKGSWCGWCDGRTDRPRKGDVTNRVNMYMYDYCVLTTDWPWIKSIVNAVWKHASKQLPNLRGYSSLQISCENVKNVIRHCSGLGLKDVPKIMHTKIFFALPSLLRSFCSCGSF